MEDSEQYIDDRLRTEILALRSDLAAMRFLFALRRRAEERKHNPNWAAQPRAPRGASDGGQWVGGGGASVSEPTGRITTIADGDRDDAYDTNGLPTAGWAEPDWDYPAFPHTARDGEQFPMSAESEPAAEAIITAFNAVEALNYRRIMGRSAEDAYEDLLIERGAQYYRSVTVTTREGVRVYDFLELGPYGWEFVEIKANRAIATPRQTRIDTAVQIFGFPIEFDHFQGIQGPTNVRLRRAVPSDRPSRPEW